MNTDQNSKLKTALITGGRSPAALELARQFHALNYRVLLAESMPNYLSKVSSAVDAIFTVAPPNQNPVQFIRDLKKIIVEHQVDLFIPTCEEVFFVSRGLNELATLCTVCVDQAEKLALLHSKWEFNQEVARLGMNAPKTFLARNAIDLSALLTGLRPVVIKPVFSRFASKAYILKTPEQKLPEIVISPEYPWVVQEFISGREICTYSVAKNGQLLAHVTYDHRFTAGKGAGISFEAIQNEAALRWVTRFVKEMNFTGQLSFDFIENENGQIYPLECNPRATSGIHLFSPSDRLDKALAGHGDLKVPSVGSIATISIAMILYGLPSIRSFKDSLEWIKIFFRAREVIFSWKDPMPFFNQFVCVYLLWRMSLGKNKSLLEMSTHDIEWNGVE